MMISTNSMYWAFAAAATTSCTYVVVGADFRRRRLSVSPLLKTIIYANFTNHYISPFLPVFLPVRKGKTATIGR